MTDGKLTYRAVDEAGTERLGRALAAALVDGGFVALNGPLGAGKTRLVQATAAAAGVDRRDVVSPTFVLVHEYRGSRPVLHADAYRLNNSDEFLQLGLEESFGPPNLVFVEWADRVADCLPVDRLEIAISVLADDTRQFDIVGHGPRGVEIVARLRGELA